MTDDHLSHSEFHDDEVGARRRLSGWQKVLLVASVVIMVAGGSLMAIAALTGTDDGSTSSATPFPAAGFAGQSTGTTPEQDGPLEAWSPTVFRLGFSFFVGFAIAYALRSFVKLSIITIGFLLLGLFGLQYAGVIDVNWAAMEQHYDTVAEWLRTQTASFTAFVRGYLPSAGAGGFGFVTGFRRR